MPTEQVEAGSLDELIRIAALALRYQGAPKAVIAHDLSKAGLPPARIADLIDSTSNAVSQYKRAPRPEWPSRRAEADGNG
jgi:hypothetical protein